MSMSIGAPAPEFRAEAWVRNEAEPRTVALEDYRGRWVVLFFYPRDFTFVCPTELQAFGVLNREFRDEDAVVLACSTDSYWSHRAWFTSEPRLHHVEYPVLADPAHGISRSYGVLLQDGAAARATFVIDPEGILRHVSVTDLQVGRNVQETLRVLQALRTGELCPAGWRPGHPTLVAVAS